MAQETNITQFNQTRTGIPHLNGSVNVLEQTNQFIRDSIQVPFATALETAQAEVGNDTAISGRIGVVQGYLVYTFKVANFDAETSRMIVVDAGNAEELYTSEEMPLYFSGLICGEVGGHQKGFGNHWGSHDKGGEISYRSNSDGQSTGGRVVASPAIGV